MTVCYQSPSIRCKSLSSSLKDRFSKCSLFAGKFSVSGSDAEDAAVDFDEEDEVTNIASIAALSPFSLTFCSTQTRNLVCRCLFQKS